MKHFLMRTLLLTGAFLFGYYYSFGQIVISEFSYDPPESGTDSLEFVEIVNIGNQPVDISGYKLWFGSTLADRFTYPANTILAPNQVSVIAVNPGALLRNYDMTTLAHQWTGTSGLGNNGSKIVIRNANNVTVDSISYTNSSAPSGTNGNGKTAVLCDLTLDNNVMSNWTASTNAILRNGLPHTINGKALYGSPGFLECGLTTEPADQWNDECTSATVLSIGTQCTATEGNLLDATESMGGCTGWGDANDLWYSFVATTNNLLISVTTEEDVVLEIFEGSCGDLTSIECVDYDIVNEVYNSSDFILGETYFVRVYAYDFEDLITGDFTICVQGIVAPENDECVDAIVLSVGENCTPTTGNLHGATESLEGCAGYNEANDVWYSFVATSSILEISVETQEDVVLQVFEGTCGSLDDMVCVDDYLENENYASTDFVVGQTYFVRVYAYDYNDLGVGDFTICVQGFTTVINNDCSTATTLISSTTCTPVSGTLINSTVSDIEDECNNYENHDVWYSFVAQSANTTIIVESLDLMDPIISVYTGACGSLTQVSCEDDEGGEIEELELSNLTVGSTYFIRVTDYHGGSDGSTEFSICVTHEASVDPCADVTITGAVTGCGPEATVVADGGTSPHTFEWSNGETTDSVTNLMVGETYTITITDNNGCTGQTTYVPVDCPITDPCVNVVVTGVVSGCDGELDVVPAGGIDPYTYLWSNGATTQGASIPFGEEEYFVTITDANGCTGTVEFEWLPCAAISNVDGFHSLMVYPNPTSNQVTIEIATLTSEQLTIELINAMGQVVMSTEVFNNGQQAHNLSLVDMSTGMYVISIKGREFVKTERLNVIK